MKKQTLYLSTNYFRGLYIYIAILALFLGGAIYILFRVSKPVFFNLIFDNETDSWITFARHKASSLCTILPDWIIFSLPDGLWSFAYTLVIIGIWSGSKSWLRYLWMATIPLLALGLEILQYTGTVPGTFCRSDLAFETAGIIMGILVGMKTIKP